MATGSNLIPPALTNGISPPRTMRRRVDSLVRSLRLSSLTVKSSVMSPTRAGPFHAGSRRGEHIGCQMCQSAGTHSLPNCGDGDAFGTISAHSVRNLFRTSTDQGTANPSLCTPRFIDAAVHYTALDVPFYRSHASRWGEVSFLIEGAFVSLRRETYPPCLRVASRASAIK